MRQADLQLLESLQKAVHSGNITAIVPEDLETEAHNTLWEESDPGELTLLKLLPSVPATSIVHEYTKITSYGNKRDTGFFGERSLPPETNFESQRVSVNIRLMGEIGPTFLLAALEKTQKALGTSGAQNIERAALRKNVLFKKARNLYFSDTRTTRLGANSLRFAGLFQQIQEGTDGTVGTSPYGSHIIDMEGQDLTADNIRAKIAQTGTLFGRFTSLVMDPIARAKFEGSLDPATRLDFPLSAQPYLIGQQIGGIRTGGGVTFFESDNTLTPIYARPKYDTNTQTGAPAAPTSVVATAQTDNSSGDTVTSKWDADSAGNVFHVVTQVVDELEGLGVRAPSSSYTAVAAGQEVKLVITPSLGVVDSYKVYRGDDSGTGLATDAWFIFEVAGNATGAAVTCYDNNLYRPNTSWAFGLNVVSSAERAMHGGMVDSYWQARDKSASFLQGNDRPGKNTVAVAELGPSMGIMALASVLAQVDRPLVYSAAAPEVRNPLQNMVFINIAQT